MSDLGSSRYGFDGRGSHEALLADLVADLRPVRPVGAPWKRAMLWLSLVFALAVVLAWFADMPAMMHRLMVVPDMWLAVSGSALTAILACIAAFQLSSPDRSPRWALLPLPALALWIGASGIGCFRTWLIPGVTDASLMEAGHCVGFIVGLSLPLSAVILWMLRRGYSLYPSLMGAMAGLGAGGAAATLLNFFHPYDAALSDLAMHTMAVLLVIGANRALGGRVLGVGSRPNRRGP